MTTLHANAIQIHILVVDDHPMVRAGLQSMLHTDPELMVVGEAETAADAVAQAKTLQPEVILLDIHLPDSDGMTALEQLKDVAPDARVLIVTINENDAYIKQAMQAGAAGYILKGVRRHQLIDAVSTVVREQPTPIPFLLSQTSMSTHIANQESGLNLALQLSPVEYELLNLLAEGDNNKEIAAKMKWSLSTVKKYLQRLFQTLDVSDRSQAVAVAFRAGLIE